MYSFLKPYISIKFSIIIDYGYFPYEKYLDCLGLYSNSLNELVQAPPNSPWEQQSKY